MHPDDLDTSNCLHLPGGLISVVTPTYLVHCGFDMLTVCAIDDSDGQPSNTVLATLGSGPC